MNERRYKLRGRHVRENLKRLIDETPDDPCMEVVVRPYRQKRNLDQNAKIHAAIRPYAEAWGMTVESMKDWLNIQIMGGVDEVCPDGTMTRRPLKGTSDFTVDEASYFIDNIDPLMMEMECQRLEAGAF